MHGITSLPPGDLPAPDDAGSPLWRSCGRPLPGTQVEVRGKDGTSLPEGERGDMCVRSPAVMLGYYQDPERTAETVGGGWLRTGDVGCLDSRGYLYLVDRERDIITTGHTSDNVYSRLLEDFLLTLPGVQGAAAVGVPDEEEGERVRICLAPDHGIDVGAVTDAVTAELGTLCTPQETVLLSELPMTQVGKVDKCALRRLVTAEGASRSPAHVPGA